MRITICTIGKHKPGPYTELFKDYLRRISIKINIVELEVKKNLDIEALKKAEARLLLAEIKQDSYVIVLDERGQNITSCSFAEIISNQFIAGTKEIIFIIGGAYGLDESVRQRANFILSFGKLVWPHQMVRVMLIEQIYRALMISQGHPYHK